MKHIQEAAEAVLQQLETVVFGKRPVLELVLNCLLAEGHLLLEDVPGTAKTLLAKALARTLGGGFRRLQCTPDLLPGDVTGSSVFNQKTGEFEFIPGPVFTQILLADEVNRATPRAQAALLECMAERQVSVDNRTYPLERPFFVIATQNPVEMYGTYPLPEAELDRFFLKLNFDFPPAAELNAMVARTTGGEAAGLEPVDAVADAETVARMRALVRQVPAAAHVVDYATRLVLSLHPEQEGASEQLRRCVRLGPSPRGIQALVLAGRVAALIDGRTNLAVEDVRAVAHSALRHRLVLTIDAERQGVGPDEIIDAALDAVPREA